jgi:hypothetical protein
MNAMPEFFWIVVLLAVFAGVFLLSNLTARARGYKE